jgi:hypothetical protein
MKSRPKNRHAASVRLGDRLGDIFNAGLMHGHQNCFGPNSPGFAKIRHGPLALFVHTSILES